MLAYQAYQAHAQNKGTLLPGQLLTVNKYSVQVERYLAQGGFAHVYLVTTATPVYNTTRHVLKRIAVANEAMLAEVKKEVDIMRLLKGHPNIVHLIDAAWHRTPNGLFEVFILMEFCPGGGLIDMMNRRLRERLTEAEILQIFVDVCEGVAAMHHLRPPLLHRDLKVENILQATATSFKLCDFGSATTVASRPPATGQEIRALEADLNRHTTLQYRAPEMVDPYLRRPVDEKSDVWALGVLLYKLCYYTTPFEEHGPLAILNAQYRFPPYPVYSAQINALIASILREHGAQRPTVFELLATAHGMRGTKSAFTYITPSAPPLPPRLAQPVIQAKPQKQLNRQASGPSVTTSPSKQTPNVGIQAREKVLEAIAPMRRGRPSSSKDPPSRPRSRPGSPQKPSNGSQLAIPPAGKTRPDWLDESFSADDEKAWRDVFNLGVDANAQVKRDKGLNDAWALKSDGATSKAVPTIQTFDDDFGTKLWDSTSTSPPDNALKSTAIKYRPPAFTGSEPARSNNLAITKVKVKDAFGDLGLGNSTQPPAPTLGEARRLRTGLATMTAGPQVNANQSKPGGLSNRPTPSPRPSHQSRSPSHFQSSPSSHTPSPNYLSSWKPLNQSLMSERVPSFVPDGLPVESRFPSLEELDATFSQKHGSDVTDGPKSQPVDTLLQPPFPPRNRVISSETTNSFPPSSYVRDGKEVKPIGLSTRNSGGNRTSEEPIHEATQKQASRPPLRRKHRSTHSFQTAAAAQTKVLVGSADSRFPTSGSKLELPGLGTPSSRLSPRLEQKDWLTGDDNDLNPRSSAMGPPTVTTPALRSSPLLNVQSVEKGTVQAPHGFIVPPPAASSSSSQMPTSNTAPTTSISSVTFSRIIPPVSKPLVLDQSIELSRRRSPDKSLDQIPHARILGSASATTPDAHKDLPVRPTPDRLTSKDLEKDSSSDDGPEDVDGYMPSSANAQDVKRRDQVRKSHKGRQSSVHDLVDLWGGSASTSTNSAGSSFKADSNTRKQLVNTAPLSASTQSSMKPLPRSTSPLPLFSAPPDSRETSRVSKSANPDAEYSSKLLSSAGSMKSPVSTKSRPQSMFLFPVSKSTSDGTSPTSTSSIFSAGLVPPDEPKPRATRRTSISDMVQMYESIGRTNVPLPVLPKATTLKATHTKESSNFSKPQPPASTALIPKGTEETDLRVGSSLALPADSQKTSSSRNRSSPTHARRDTGLSKGSDKAMPSKPRPFESSSSLELLDDKLTSRKPMTSTEDTLNTTDERPPSPDQPYQGVGKLIAQWQRKSEEADSGGPPLNPRRGGLVGKRAALTSGGADKGR